MKKSTMAVAALLTALSTVPVVSVAYADDAAPAASTCAPAPSCCAAKGCCGANAGCCAAKSNCNGN